MNTEAFTKAYYNQHRNGTDKFHYNPLYRKFLYSDGVQECAEAGCYWLLDILGTELPAVFKAHPDGFLMTVTVEVKDGKAAIEGSFHDYTVEYRRKIDWTDMPDGKWVFLVSGESGGPYHCILLTEY